MPSLDITQARRYLEALAPICENGYVTIHRLKGGLPGNAHKIIDTALRDLNLWVQRSVDTYMCLAATSDAVPNSPLPRAVRKSNKVVGTKALWMDLDIKEDTYTTVAELKNALSTLIQAFLPPSFIVKSGGKGGMHVYWICNELIPPDKFDKLSAALVDLALKNNIKFDTACTKDRVRVLRPAGTFNFKHGTPDAVTILYDNQKLIYSIEQLEQKLNITNDSDDDDVLEQPKSTFAPSDIDQVATACPFVAKSLEAGGTNHNKETLWTYTIMLASFCANAKDTAIRFSNKHPSYREEDVVEKLQYHIDDHKTNPKVGPPKCETLHRAGAIECATCPHLALKRSPLNVPGASVSGSFQQQSTNNNDLPYGYFRGKDQHIYGEVLTKEGMKEVRKVFPYQIKYQSAWAEPNCADYHMHFITYEEGHKEKPIVLPYSATSDDSVFKKTLSTGGIVFKRYNKETREFMLSFQEKLRSMAGGMIRGEAIGWTMKNGEFEAFSFDGQCFSPNGITTAPKLRMQSYIPMGSPQPWIELAQIITEQQRPGLDVLLLSGFAAPLVPMTGHSGIILGCYSSETGIGKTTTMGASTAIWGHPVNSRCGLSDTINMAMNKAGQIKHLPLNWDEIKTKYQFDNVSNIIFQMTEGREKGRLNRAAEQKDMKDFQTMLTYAANSSLLDAVQENTKGTSAGIVRDFEFRIPAPQGKSGYTTSEVQNLLYKLTTNYGMIGLEYAKYLGQNGRSIHKDIITLQAAFENKFNVGSDERYWASAVTILLSAAKIFNAQKWGTIDITNLYNFLVREFIRMRKRKDKSPTDYTKEQGLITVLAQYFSINRANNTIILNKIWTARNRPPIGAIEMEGRGTSKENNLKQINIAIGRENKMIRFTDSSLGHFCRQRDIPVSTIREGLANLLGAIRTNSIITSGVPELTAANEPCWLLKLEGTLYEKQFGF